MPAAEYGKDASAAPRASAKPAPPVETDSGPGETAASAAVRRDRGGARLFIALAILIPAMCLIPSYLLVQSVGLYLDDYTHKNLAIDPVSGESQPIFTLNRVYAFPVRVLTCLAVTTFSGWLPEFEFWVRLSMALAVGVNALLLGWLVIRLAPSMRLAAVIAGWLYTAPYWTAEAVLWVSACFYVYMVMGTLLYLHACLRALGGERFLPNLGLALFCLMGTIGFGEVTLTALAAVPLMAVVLWLRNAEAATRLMRRTAGLVAGSSGLVALAYLVLYRNSHWAARRSRAFVPWDQVTTRLNEFVDSLEWMTVSRRWGLPIGREALELGWREISSGWLGPFLIGVCVGLLLFAAYALPSSLRKNRASIPVMLCLLLLGLGLALSGVMLPAALITGQILEYRMLYFPTAGVALAVGAVVELSLRWTPRDYAARVLLFIAGLALIVESVAMCGYGRAFSRRYQLDVAQLKKLTSTIPSRQAPPNTVFAFLALNQEFSSEHRALSKVLCGALETPWSARSALIAAYRRKDLRAVTHNRWTGCTFGLPEARGTGRPLSIQGEIFQADRVLLVTEREGRFVAVARLHFSEGAHRGESLELPLGAQLAGQGVETVELVVPEGKPIDTAVFHVADIGKAGDGPPRPPGEHVDGK